MPKIYKKLDKMDDKFFHMSECNGQVDIGMVDQYGQGLGCLIGVHKDNRIELIKHNSHSCTDQVLSHFGTIIPTVNVSGSPKKMVSRQGCNLEIHCLNGFSVSVDFAEKFAFSLLNICYEIRKDAQS